MFMPSMYMYYKSIDQPTMIQIFIHCHICLIQFFKILALVFVAGQTCHKPLQGPKGVHMYKGVDRVGVHFADFISFFLNIP